MPNLTNDASEEDIGLLRQLAAMFDVVDPVPPEVLQAGYGPSRGAPSTPSWPSWPRTAC